MAPQPECVCPIGAMLGEGPRWNSDERALYFVDIKAPALHCFLPATREVRSWAMQRQIGFIAFAKGPRLLGGFEDGIFWIDAGGRRDGCIVDPEPHAHANRLNDGTVDGYGNLWFGSMDNNEQAETGSLYRLSPQKDLTVVDRNYCITNGPAFSPDGQTLYHTDTMKGVIYRFEMDGGRALNRRIFAKIDPEEGYPDGLTVDSEGGVWSGLWGGWGLVRFSPDGERMSKLCLPAANVTACAFGGDDLDQLFITTARKGLSENDLQQQPLAGGLFVACPGVRGLAPHRFG